jgi:dTDP-4-dehydrorhamnose 3,5-epimerase
MPLGPTVYRLVNMKFNATPLAGAFLVDIEMLGDSRGFFARAFCENEFGAHGLPRHFVQMNNALSRAKGTLRGMHYQLPPAAEVKAIRCLRGALFDVIVDLRPDSPTFKKWFGAELTAENRRMMVVPKGCAHGFITLEDDTEAFYLVSAHYSPENERGLRYNDPAVAIDWPIEPVVLSQKDMGWPDLSVAFHGIDRMRGLG